MDSTYTFDRFEVRAASRELREQGSPVALGARAFDLLLALIERRDRTVTKNELLDVVWPGVVVEENNLQVQISTLRRVLGPQAIATIPGRGYRFAGALKRQAEPTDPEDEARPAVAAALPSTNLPRELPRLYGRATDVEALCAQVRQHRIVTVVGAGGIGKSRLAEAAAARLAGEWPDGAWLVELAGLSDPELVPQAVARILNVTTHGGGSAAAELVAGLASRNALLVLDNCEHLLEAIAALVHAILQGASGMSVLATSQEPLRLSAEQQFRLLPLVVPEASDGAPARESGALALLEARVRAADPRFELRDDNMEAAIDVCRRLDGLPLAIELAAARIATLGLRPVRDKLDARLRLLTGGARATLRRHQTLRAALEWSHNLLGPDEQAVFRRLGVFAGGFTMAAAQSVVADERLDEWQVLEHLSALVEKSLVVAEPGDAPRYRLLESARAYALEQLAAHEMPAMLERHARAMAAFLARIDSENQEGELRTDQFAALVLPDLDNLRAAHAWATGPEGDREVAFALAVHAGSLIDYAAECVEWLQAVRGAEVDARPPALAARYWRALTASNMAHRVPRSEQVEAASRARALYEALGQPRRVFGSLIQLARHHSAQGDRAAAQAAVDAAGRLLRSDWPPEFTIMQLRMRLYIAAAEGRRAEALKLARECIRASDATGDWRLAVMARTNLVDTLWQDPADAEEAANEVCALAQAIRARPAADGDAAVVFANLLGIMGERGRLDEAAQAAREGLSYMRRTGTYYLEAWAYFFYRLGRTEVAVELLGTVEAELARFGGQMQPNEQRLLAQARPALAAQVAPEHFEALLAKGRALSRLEVLALLNAELAAMPAATA